MRAAADYSAGRARSLVLYGIAGTCAPLLREEGRCRERGWLAGGGSEVAAKAGARRPRAGHGAGAVTPFLS